MMFRRKKYIRKLWFLAFFMAAAVAAGALVKSRQPAALCRNEDLVYFMQAMDQEADADDGSPDEEKVVYLTFDDGPSKVTEDVLDILKEEGVPATFFVIAAENNEKYLPVLSRTASEGHLIALHSGSHQYSTIYASPEAFWQDLAGLREKLTPYVGNAQMNILRFPGGSTNTVSRKYGGSSIMKELKAQAETYGFRYVDWNVCANDAVGGRHSPSEIYKNVVEEAAGHNTCVVLMHDTKKETVQALGDIIRWFKNAGYRFDTVDHMPKST
ncbi:MAG: polysaccharide deacetylase family protein [Ruthenibacterium sp.]